MLPPPGVVGMVPAPPPPPPSPVPGVPVAGGTTLPGSGNKGKPPE